VLQSFVSFANICIPHVTFSGRSFTYRINSRGPNVDPCGTPLYTSVQPDLLPFTATSVLLYESELGQYAVLLLSKIKVITETVIVIIILNFSH